MNNRCVIISWWSKHHIPEELWPEILFRVPVKSLLRFRCVSTSWRSLIDDPDFCRLQLNHFNNNLHETQLLVAKQPARLDRRTKIYIVQSLSDTVQSSELTWLKSSSNTMLFSEIWRIVCSMDGLVLLKDYQIRDGPIMLWNPSIRRARILPPSPVNTISEEEKLEDRGNADLGFGFDPLIKDYKLVRLVHDYKYESGKLLSIVVYTVGDGLWKTIQFQGKGRSDWCWCFSRADGNNTLCFRGALYFILWNYTSETQDLVSFDLSKEVFASIALPVELRFNRSASPTLVDDGGCSLKMIRFTFTTPGVEVRIWGLESCSRADMSSMVWTKCFTVAPIPSTYNFHAGDLCRRLVILYLKKTGDLVLTATWRRVMLYNMETCKRKTLLKRGSKGALHDRVCEYKESLLLLNG